MDITTDIIPLLVNWLPILVLIGVFIYFAKRSQSVYTSRSGKTHGEMLEEYIVEMKRQNDLLEKVVQDQETRLQRLETTKRSSSSASSSTSSSTSGGNGGGGAR